MVPASVSRWDALARPLAAARGVPLALVQALVWQESRGNPDAYRYEPHIDDASYGLMQVLFGTAQGMGYRGTAAGLFDPAVSLRYGVQYIGDALQAAARAGYPPDSAVSVYNGGPSALRRGDGKRRADGTFINQAYVDSVMARWREWAPLAGELPPVVVLPGIEVGPGAGADGGGAAGGLLVVVGLLAALALARGGGRGWRWM